MDTHCLSPGLEAAIWYILSAARVSFFYLLLPINMVCAISQYCLSNAVLLPTGGNKYLHLFSQETYMEHMLLTRSCCCRDERPHSQAQEACGSVVEIDIKQITVRCEVKTDECLFCEWR